MTTPSCPSSGRTCPTGGQCPSSPRCPNYAHEQRVQPSLAVCMLDLPRGFELTQSEVAAVIGISERQLRRTETKLLAALRGVRALRELRREFFSSEKATIFGPDVRSPDTNVQDGEHAPRANLSSPESDVAPREPDRRAGLLSPPRRFATRKP